MHLCMSFMCSSQEWIKWALFAFAFIFFIEKTAIQNNSHKYDWFDNTKLLISSFFRAAKRWLCISWSVEKRVLRFYLPTVMFGIVFWKKIRDKNEPIKMEFDNSIDSNIDNLMTTNSK